MSDEKTPVAYLHQVVCGDGEPDQALSFEPDNFPLAGILGYRSLSHEPLFRAPLNNELERLRTELGRAYRALHAFAFADREGKRLNETAVMYHSPTIGAAARFVHEGALDGSEYFIGKTVDVLHAALRGEKPSLKAYRCDDSDIFAAESAEQAAQLWRDMVGDDEPLEDGYPQELSDAELDARHPAFDEDERPIDGKTISVREMLAEHGNEPGWLAGSVW